MVEKSFHLFLWISLNCLLVNGFTPLPNDRTSRRASSSTRLHSVPTVVDILTSGLASFCRFPRGVFVAKETYSIPVEERPLLRKFFWIENDIQCREVSERITELDLCVDAVIPASSKSRATTDPTYDYVMESFGLKPPILVVEEQSTGTKRALEGRDEILKYFDETFGMKKDEGLMEVASQVANTVGNFLALLLRIGRGMEISKAAGPLAPRPDKPLVLYDYSGNQFSRLVREVLMELDLTFELCSVGKGSRGRDEMAAVTGGSTQCPHLIDPNTGVSMKDSKNIIEYLYRTYASYTPPSELLEWLSDNIVFWAKPLFRVQARHQAKKNDEIESGLAMDYATNEIKNEINSAPVVVYTYEWSPFSWETKALLKRSGITFEEISLGKEWIPGLIAHGGAEKRASLLEMTGQSSLPHIFVAGKSIGGLFSGTPGLVPSLADGTFQNMVSSEALKQQSQSSDSTYKKSSTPETMPFS